MLILADPSAYALSWCAPGSARMSMNYNYLIISYKTSGTPRANRCSQPFIQGDLPMRKTILAASLASAAFAVPSLAAAQAAAAPASPHTFSGNIALVSDYKFRGISQTFGKPALQGGFDYSHASGFYAGNWNSNINEGAGFPAGNLEMDFYGGWKKTWGDWGLDLGAIYYYYPGSDANATTGTLFVNPRDPTKIH